MNSKFCISNCVLDAVQIIIAYKPGFQKVYITGSPYFPLKILGPKYEF